MSAAVGLHQRHSVALHGRYVLLANQFAQKQLLATTDNDLLKVYVGFGFVCGISRYGMELGVESAGGVILGSEKLAADNFVHDDTSVSKTLSQ